MAIGDIYRVSCVGDWGGTNVAVITQHFSDISGAETLAQLGAKVRGFLTNIAGEQHSSWNWRQVNINSENLSPPISLVYTTGFPVVGGSGASDALPYPVAAIVTLRTPYAGRSYRGRNYLPAMVEANATGSSLVAGLVTNLTTYYTTHLGLYGASGSDANWRWGVYSKKLNSCVNIVSFVVRPTFATQRRRRPGVGV